MILQHGKAKQVRMSTIKFPADIREMMLWPDVKTLAESISQFGQFHPIMIRYKTKQIIAGRHRAAAMLLLKKDYIEAKVIECSDLGAELLALAENAHRRHNTTERDEVMEELVRMHLEYQEEEAKKTPYDKLGRKKKPSLKDAFEKVAELVDMKPTTVERRHYDRKKKRRGHSKSVPGIDSLGFKLTKEYRLAMNAVQEMTQSFEWHSKKLISILNKLDKSQGGFPFEVSERLREDVRETAKIMRSFRPTHLCPYCKAQAEYQKTCRFCYGLGWVGAHVIQDTPSELMDPSNSYVLVGNKLRSLDDVIEERIEQEPIIQPIEEEIL